MIGIWLARGAWTAPEDGGLREIYVNLTQSCQEIQESCATMTGTWARKGA
jgi:hypothetical protein